MKRFSKSLKLLTSAGASLFLLFSILVGPVLARTADQPAAQTSAAQWIELAAAGSPPNGVFSTDVHYDAVNNRLIVFFPKTLTGGGGNQVWILTEANGLGGTPTWIKLNPTGAAPTSNWGQSTVYDVATNRLTVYGGCTSNCGSPMSEIFVLTNANGLSGTPVWTQLSVTNPQAREEHTAVYDPTSNRMIAFGGAMAFYTTDKNDTRILSNANGATSPSTWSTLAPSGGLPGIREGQTAIYDAVSNRMIVFGGVELVHTCCPYNHREYNDTWVLSNANGLSGSPTWMQLTPLGTLPAPRNHPSAVYDSVNSRMIIYGGRYYDEPSQSHFSLGDLWELRNANSLSGASEWVPLTASGTGPGLQSDQPAAFDSTHQRMIMMTAGDTGNRVWILDLGQSNASPTNTPTVTPTLTPTPTVTPTATSSNPQVNIALNTSGTGYPNPLESDPGWGGGSYPWDMLDGKTAYTDTWAHGLAFTGGKQSWMGQPCGWRQATIDFGALKTFSRVLVWHHGEDHIPNTYVVEYWDGTNWQPTGGTSTVRWDLRSDTTTWGAIPTETIFSAVTASKVRYRLNNCDITHGWIYEFEVFAGGGTTPVPTYTPTLTASPSATPTATDTATPTRTATATPTSTPTNTATVTPSHTPTPTNQPPSSDAGGPYSVEEGGSLMLSASGDDPEGGQLAFRWDLDDDGSFETSGQTVTFSALTLDGPSAQTVHVQVTDAGGLATTDSTSIEVLNAPPSASFNSSVEFIIVGLPVNLAGSFTDPSALDTHTASINWGDGSPLQSLGLVTNPFGSVYTYRAAGIYTLTLTVADDDGGIGTATATITVVAPTGATQAIITDLKTLAQDPTLTPQARTAIQSALVRLDGANGGKANNGALDHLQSGDWNAALQQIKQAIQDLQTAEAADPSLNLMIAKQLLTWTAQSVASEVVARAATVANTPAKQQMVNQAKNLLAQGESLLEAGDYLGAVAKFQSALQKAQSVL